MENLMDESISVLATDSESEEAHGVPEEVLRSIVECPICVQIPIGKVYQCNNSHNICDNCFGKLTDRLCPQGRCSYRNQEPSRNRTVEEMIEKCNFTIECPNENCKLRMKAREMRMHLKTCPERAAVLCFVSGACGKIHLDELDEHLIKEHGMDKYENEDLQGVEFEFALSTSLTSGTYVSWTSSDNHHVYVIEKIDSEHYYVWATVNGDQDLAKKYSLKIEMCKRGTPFRILLVLPVLPVGDASFGHARDTECCFQVSRERVIALHTKRNEEDIEEGEPDQALDCYVEIQKMNN